MTHPHVDPSAGPSPFEKPPAESEGRMAFGTLRVFTNKVNLTKGASYILDALGIDPDDPASPLNRLTDRNGNLWEFKGKQQVPNGSHTHIIPVITRRASDGRVYNDFRDFMYWQNDVCQRVTIPSLQKFFGAKLAGIWGKTAEVQAEVVEVEDGDYKRQAFKIVKLFKTVAEREAAETEFFAQFQTDEPTPDQIVDEMMGEEPIPFGDDKDKPVGMSKAAAVGLLSTFWAASGQDKDKFLAQLKGMPVVLAALEVHKVALETLPEIVVFYAKDTLESIWDKIQKDSEIDDKKDAFLYLLQQKEVLLQALGGIDAPEIQAYLV